MLRLIKIIHSTFTACLAASSFGGIAYAAEPLNKLMVYAGPQSAVPQQIIYVTVEAVDRQGRSLDDYPVTLTYNADGAAQTMTAKPINGLVSFDVTAQKQAGLMTFLAHYKASVSKTARVVVIADQPTQFSLLAKLSKQTGAIDVSSSLITDRFGNHAAGLSLVVINWIDAKGLQASQTTQLSNGRIIFTALCPKNFSAPLHISAALKNIYVTSADISALCASRRG